MAEPWSVAPPEVTRYFDAKGVKPSFHWSEVSPAEHAMAHTVAKSAGFDILRDTQAAVSKAIREGQDFATFAKELEPVLRAKGWWGKANMLDPQTGKMVAVELGSPRRLRTIYWGNVRTAYAAGQWERIQRTKRVMPYLIYVMTTALHPREEHLTWVNTILPVDDPWWSTHYPPNGWNCQCRVRQVSESEAEERGYNVEDPERPEDYGSVDWLNKRTGEFERIPGGIDPGWNGNPGATRVKNLADMIAGKLDQAPEEARRIAVEDMTSAWMFKRIQSGGVRYDRTITDDIGNAARGAIATPVAVMPETFVKAMEAETSVVRLSVADADKQQRLRLRADKTEQLTPEDYATVQRLIDRGEAILQSARELVFQGLVKGRMWIAALRRAESQPGEVYLKSFRRVRPGQEITNRARGEVLRGGSEEE